MNSSCYCCYSTLANTGSLATLCKCVCSYKWKVYHKNKTMAHFSLHVHQFPISRLSQLQSFFYWSAKSQDGFGNKWRVELTSKKTATHDHIAIEVQFKKKWMQIAPQMEIKLVLAVIEVQCSYSNAQHVCPAHTCNKWTSQFAHLLQVRCPLE